MPVRRPARERDDAIVVGSGPNGLAAAITLAEAGRSVRVLEAAPTPGGGTRSAELTLPGYVHDVCSAVHPLAVASPFFRRQDLGAHGLALVHPEIPLAHPLADGRAAALHRDIERTASGLGEDGDAWRRLVGGSAARFATLVEDILAPPLHVPRDPRALAGFAGIGLLPAVVAARALATPEARALFAGSAAHSFLALEHPVSAAFGLVLSAAGHAVGWPVARGGSERIADALAARLRTLGGEIECRRPVRGLGDLPPARAVLFDVPPPALAAIAGTALPARAARRMRRFRRGPGVFKLDAALSAPVPWRAPECRRAGTVHVGGTLEEIAAAEAAVAAGRHPERPFVLVAQQSVADPSRAPAGGHTLWAYCHVPNGSAVDMTEPILRQIERFAPGVRDVIVALHAAGPAWFAAHNPNALGGDVAGGSMAGAQALRRPALVHPYRTGNPRLLLCSASTPPGGGVHGMCGHHAARDALATVLR